MKVTFITSACILIEFSNGYKVLCDPWLSEGIFYGTWFHNPPLKEDWRHYFKFNPPNAIYISHIHQDHCDINTLEPLNVSWLHQSIKVPVLIADFEDKALHNLLKKSDFRNMPQHGIDITKAAGPELDSFALFTDPLTGAKLLNMNDCMFEDVEQQLKDLNIQDLDLACLPYSGASCYPQCFDNLSHFDKLEEKEKVINKYLRWFHKYIELLKPEAVLPFAGQYKLKDEKLNSYLALPDAPEGLGYLKPIEGNVFYIGLNKLVDKAKEKLLNHYSGSTGLLLEYEGYAKWVINPESKSFLIIKITKELLWEVLTKKKHWNNLELASLLRFERIGGEYDKELHYNLSYFHI